MCKPAMPCSPYTASFSRLQNLCSVLQFLLALLAGVGAFTVLHILGFGTIYKVQNSIASAETKQQLGLFDGSV